jgi:NAD(P)-dependent dehydrogenase (short-subunit alcohol dehydrogenase family)
MPIGAPKALYRKTVHITGGRSGIGYAAVEILAANGANVGYGDIAPADFAHSNVFYHRTDVTDFSTLQSLFKFAEENFRPVDIVLANARVHEDQDRDNEEWLNPSGAGKVIDVNYVGVVSTVKLSLLSFKSRERMGSIVITGSASSYHHSI